MTISSHPSELNARFLSNNSLDPWVDVNSASRKVMFAGQMPQALTIVGGEERYWQTGAEPRFGEYCFSVKAPCDMEVLRVIQRFPRSRTIGTTIKNPQTIVIYVDLDTREVGCLDLKDFNQEHPYFGFVYNKTEAYGKITKGAVFEKGTEFLTSPALKAGGGYGYGCNLLFANMSHPAVSEDGIGISRSAIKKMSFDIEESRVVTWGQNRFALNLEGDENEYRICRDVGQYIRPDGLLMATREYDERLAVNSLGVWDTMMLDMTYDDKTYTRPGEGLITDIMVFHDNRSLPNGMYGQIEKYKELTDRFYYEILEEYNIQLKSRGGKFIRLSEEFHRLVVEACAMTDYDVGEVVQKIYHKAPIDDWRVEFKIRYRMLPNIGNKLTDTNGGKGVACLIMEDEDMPVNDHGVRVDVIMSMESPYNRQNFGGLYEPEFNQVTREFLTTVRGTIRIDEDEKPSKAEMLDRIEKEPEVYEDIWADLMKMYSYLSHSMHDEYTSNVFDSNAKRAEHLSWILKKPCLYILSPTDDMVAWREAVKNCNRDFPPRITPLTFKDYNGNIVRTEEPIDIGHKYFIILEKISDDWIAVSTAKVQHLGMLGQVTSSDKYSNPAKMQAVKALSEAEVRMILSYCGENAIAELMDANGSLDTHREVNYSILDSNKPTDIKRAVDRRKKPLKGPRSVKLCKHILECNGYEFVYEEYRDPDIGKRDLFIDKNRERLF